MPPRPLRSPKETETAMNALDSALRSTNGNVPRQSFATANSSSRPQRRERDFGVGYGNSSGYAAPRRYIGDNGPRLFRLA